VDRGGLSCCRERAPKRAACGRWRRRIEAEALEALRFLAHTRARTRRARQCRARRSGRVRARSRSRWFRFYASRFFGKRVRSAFLGKPCALADARSVNVLGQWGGAYPRKRRSPPSLEQSSMVTHLRTLRRSCLPLLLVTSLAPAAFAQAAGNP